jgi:hypothetical protein
VGSQRYIEAFLGANSLHCDIVLVYRVLRTPYVRQLHARTDLSVWLCWVQKQFGLGQEQIEALYNYGKMAYDSGRYEAARELLHQYNTYSVDVGHIISSTWGKLACEILLQDVRPCCVIYVYFIVLQHC